MSLVNIFGYLHTLLYANTKFYHGYVHTKVRKSKNFSLDNLIGGFEKSTTKMKNKFMKF